jgi:transposase
MLFADEVRPTKDVDAATQKAHKPRPKQLNAAMAVIEVIAPSKTPRGRGDRVKTDRKDAELLARCLIAGSLTPVVVPSMRSKPRVSSPARTTRAAAI